MSTDDPPRMSRYRSTRRAAGQTSTAQSTIPPVPSANAAPNRMKSARYHARPSTRHGGTEPTTHLNTMHSHNFNRSAASSMDDMRSRSQSIDSQRSPPIKRGGFTPLPAPPPPAIAPPSSFAARSNTVSGRPHTSHGKGTTSRSREDEKEQMRQLATLEEQTRRRQEEIRLAELDSRAMRKRREEQLRQAEEERRRAIRELEEKEAKRRQKEEEEIRRAEEDKARTRRKKEEEAEEARKRKLEKEQLKRAEEEEAGLWAAKKKMGRNRTKSGADSNNPNAQQNPSPKRVQEAVAPTTSPPPREKFGFLKKWMVDEPPIEDKRPKTSSGDDQVPPVAIKPGGGGIVPLADAPVSAANYGDRRVRVESQGKSILLAVKPSTTPLQLIRASVTHFTVPIDPRNSMLLEPFTKSGIQRPLRMYEHVRDVLNSWDTDDQHILTLQPYDSNNDTMLYSGAAPSSKPSGGSWTLYFSQKRGKWDKRHVTMTNDGQINVAKNETGKDSMSVCNMSDFEIFSLTRDGERKKVRPPKKYCYAVKSMQKSNMFLGDTGFMHLFCSNDEKVAKGFHDAVFKWRSWYLVNVMGEGKDKKITLDNHSAPLLSSKSTHHRRGSSQASQYILGSFNTDLNFDASTFTMEADQTRPKAARLADDAPLAGVIAVPTDANGAPSALEHSKALHARKVSLRRAAQGPPPSQSVHNRTISANSARQVTSPNAPTFDNPPRSSSGSSGNGGTGGLNRSTSIRSNRSSLNGGMRIPFPSQPLIDLTPQYVAPPQHQKKGRGFKPDRIGPGGLVDCATGLDLPGAIVIPESRAWRAGPAAPSTGTGITGRSRGLSNAGNATGARDRSVSVSQQKAYLGSSQSHAANAAVQRSRSVRTTARGSISSGAVPPLPVGGPGRGLLGELPGNEGFTGGGLLGGAQRR